MLVARFCNVPVAVAVLPFSEWSVLAHAALLPVDSGPAGGRGRSAGLIGEPRWGAPVHGANTFHLHWTNPTRFCGAQTAGSPGIVEINTLRRDRLIPSRSPMQSTGISAFLTGAIKHRSVDSKDVVDRRTSQHSLHSCDYRHQYLGGQLST